MILRNNLYERCWLVCGLTKHHYLWSKFIGTTAIQSRPPPYLVNWVRLNLTVVKSETDLGT